MIQIIHCTACGKEGRLPVVLKFGYKDEFCKSCHHVESRDWTFHFCSLDCMFLWSREKKIDTDGIPCHDCFSYEAGGPTGYFAGFKENGVCTTCKGTRRVKGIVTS